MFFGDAITLSYIISDFGELRRLGGSKVEVKNIAFFAELPGNVAGFHREGVDVCIRQNIQRSFSQ